MAKKIDKQTMLGLIVEAKRTDPETGSFSEWLAEYLAEHLPTLTPPNEPLTLEQLREMVDQPAYLYIYDTALPSGWHIIKAVTKDKIIFRGWQTVYVPIDGMGIDYNLYRRPPGGRGGHMMDIEKLIKRLKCPQIQSCPMDGEYPSCKVCQKDLRQEVIMREDLRLRGQKED